jgi:hypothetical protein
MSGRCSDAMVFRTSNFFFIPLMLNVASLRYLSSIERFKYRYWGFVYYLIEVPLVNLTIFPPNSLKDRFSKIFKFRSVNKI